MAERELPSDSEESDEDYVPSGEEHQLSEEDSDGEEGKEAGSGGEGEDKPTEKSRKRGKSNSKKGAKSRKRARVDSPAPEEASPAAEVEETEEERKRKADALWADFKQAPGPSSKPPESTQSEDREVQKEEVKAEEVVTKVFEFAGEKVEVKQRVAARGRGGLGILGRGGSGIASRAGLAGVLGQIGGKKNKLSTLEKSKLDWEGFKQQQGISEEIQTHNRGKQGYLEKQDFLQRADLRQFEIEKQMRTNSRRSNR